MTAPWFAGEDVEVRHGDCVEVMAGLPAGSVDAVVTDPPYGIGFMGQQWDQPGRHGSSRRNPSGTSGRQLHPRDRSGGSRDFTAAMAGSYDLSPAAMRNFEAWCGDWAAEAMRLLKPGGHLLAFGGARTWHRLAAGIEDAGFDIRDSIAWLYGSGFPKSLDVSKAIDRAAGATREVVGHVAQPAGNRPGGTSLHMSVRGMPESADVTAPATDEARRWQGWGTALKPSFEPIVVARKPLEGTVAGNVVEHGTGALNIDGCRVPLQPAAAHEAGRWPTNVVLQAEAAEQLDAETGTRPAGAHPARRAGIGYGGEQSGTVGDRIELPAGGASRYFPTFRWEAKAPTSERPRHGGVMHPTVKPIDLMRWLVRLVTPPGGTVLDPFAGSGTTLEAALREGFSCIGIEREAAYLPLIRSRLARPIDYVMDFGGAS